MSADLTLNKSGLDNLVKKFSDPMLKEELQKIIQKKAVAAIVAQAIADNFDKEGPGWPPLKAETIRKSVSKKAAKILEDMTDAELLKYEQRARKEGTKESFVGPNRMILQKSRLLRGTVTTPGATLSRNGISGSNIWRVDGNTLIWGTDLVYAATHNKGNPAKNIPKREFLVLREQWMRQLNDFVVNEALKIISKRFKS